MNSQLNQARIQLGQLLSLLFWGLLTVSHCFANEAQFDKANRLYETGSFKEASALYQAATTNGVSANLFFNLGNAHFKANQLGKAIAAYHQSMWLDPRNPETIANLRFARDKVSLQPPPPTLRQRLLRQISLGEWTALASGTVTLLLLLLATRQLKPNAFAGKPAWILLPTVSALVSVILLAMASADHFLDERGFVIVPMAVIRNGPLEESPESFKTPDGTELRVHDRKGEFLEIETGLSQKGWIHSDSIELLVP